MLSVASSAGIDVGKQYLDVGFFPAAKPLRVVNEPTGIAKIVSVLRARGGSEESSWRRSAVMRARSFARSSRLAFRFSSSIRGASRRFVTPKV